MKLHSPFIITARLLPGVKIGDTFISIEFAGQTSDGRARYQYHIDGPGWEHSARDLKSGVGGGSLQEGMINLLSFLGAAGDAYRYKMSRGRKSENSDLFPANVVEWAYSQSDEISLLQWHLEENKNLITA